MGEDEREVIESRAHTDALVFAFFFVVVRECLFVELNVCALLFTTKTVKASRKNCKYCIALVFNVHENNH